MPRPSRRVREAQQAELRESRAARRARQIRRVVLLLSKTSMNITPSLFEICSLRGADSTAIASWTPLELHGCTVGSSRPMAVVQAGGVRGRHCPPLATPYERHTAANATDQQYAEWSTLPGVGATTVLQTWPGWWALTDVLRPLVFVAVFAW